MEILPIIGAILWFLVLCWVALGLGGMLLRTLKISPVNPLRGFYLRIAAGLALISFATTIAGYLHLWNVWGIRITFILLALVVIPANREFIRSFRERFSERQRYSFEATILIMGIAAMWVLLFLNSLAPVINFDAERHHYLMPLLFLEHGSFFDYAPNPFPAYPMAIEMLFLDGFALGGQQVASLIDWLMGLLMILATIDVCSRYLDELTGLMAVAVFSGIAFITVLVGGGYVDISVSAFMLIGLYAMIDWYHSGESRLAILTGLFVGTAIAGKYYAALWLVFLCISTVWRLIRAKKAERKAIGRTALVALVVVLIIALPWYGRNLIKYKNPVHPFMHTFLTGERLLDDDITRWSGTKAHPKTLGNLLRYPADLTFLDPAPRRFSKHYYHPLLCLFPLFGLLGLKRPLSRMCYVYSWMFTIYAFLLIPFQTRYFIPYEMLMAISFAAGVRALSVKRPILIIFVILILVPLGYELNETRVEFTERREFITGRKSETEYLLDRKYDFQVFNHANTSLPDGSKVLYFRESTFYLTVDHQVIEDRLTFDDARNPEMMLEKLRGLGYTHVMLELDMLFTLNVLDAILDEIDYDGTGGVLGEGDLKTVEFVYWEVAQSVYEDRELSANVLPAIIDVFGGEGSQETSYVMDLSPLREKQYLAAYASFASEVLRWHDEGKVATGWFAGNTRMFDITSTESVDDEDGSKYD